jgi:hypothetical protein
MEGGTGILPVLLRGVQDLSAHIGQAAALFPRAVGGVACSDLIAGHAMTMLYDSPWPAEDGGPQRLMQPRGPGLRLAPGHGLRVTSRTSFMNTMVVLRAPGEVYLLAHSGPGPETCAWVERIDPVTLETLMRSPDLPAGEVFWPGGMSAHANGSLYVIYGRYCHKLDAQCQVVVRRELPRPTPYNGLQVLSDGNLVMKNMIFDGSEPSYLSVLEPDGLTSVGAEVAVPEGSIARISSAAGASGEYVYVVGDHSIFRFGYADGRLRGDAGWSWRYRVLHDDEQSYGWDPVVTDDDVWFMDNGAHRYAVSMHDAGVASGPLHLLRVSTRDARDVDMFTPFGLAHGTITNPPAVDPSRRIVVAYDSGNARLAGFRFAGRGRLERLWVHPFGAANHFIVYPDSGEVVVNDFHDDADDVVVLNIETGAELGRVATGSAMQSVVFMAAGFARDLYYCSFSTVARVWI